MAGRPALARNTGVRFSPPERRGVAQIEERLAWDQEVEMAEFSTPTDSLPERGAQMAVGWIVFQLPPPTVSKRAEIGAVAHSAEHSLDKRKAVGAEPTSSTVAVAKWKGGRLWPSYA